MKEPPPRPPTVIRVERDAWSMVKLLRQAISEELPPLAPHSPGPLPVEIRWLMFENDTAWAEISLAPFRKGDGRGLESSNAR